MVANRSWSDIARYTALENWREILAAMLTYATPEEFAPLCGKLMACEKKYVSVTRNKVFNERIHQVLIFRTSFLLARHSRGKIGGGGGPWLS